MTHTATERPLTTVGALLVGPSERVLLLRSHKWRDTWSVPGGKLDYGETIAAGLRRECLEETGLAIDSVHWAPTLEAVNSPEFYKPAHFILLNFIARCHSEAVTLNDEAQAYSWQVPQEALALPLNSFTRALLDYYLEHGFSGAPLHEAA